MQTGEYNFEMDEDDHFVFCKHDIIPKNEEPTNFMVSIDDDGKIGIIFKTTEIPQIDEYCTDSNTSDNSSLSTISNLTEKNESMLIAGHEDLQSPVLEKRKPKRSYVRKKHPVDKFNTMLTKRKLAIEKSLEKVMKECAQEAREKDRKKDTQKKTIKRSLVIAAKEAEMKELMRLSSVMELKKQQPAPDFDSQFIPIAIIASVSPTNNTPAVFGDFTVAKGIPMTNARMLSTQLESVSPLHFSFNKKQL